MDFDPNSIQANQSGFMTPPNFAQIPAASPSAELPKYGLGGGNSASLSGGQGSYEDQLRDLVNAQAPLGPQEPASAASGTLVNEQDLGGLFASLNQYSGNTAPDKYSLGLGELRDQQQPPDAPAQG